MRGRWSHSGRKGEIESDSHRYLTFNSLLKEPAHSFLLIGKMLFSAMGKKNRLKKQRAENAKMRTALGDHKQVGKNLIPPFLNMPGGKMQPSSWMNDRLPEMLWACLIRSAFPQDEALGYFRRILNFIAKHEKCDQIGDLTLTGISKLDEKVRAELIAFIVEPPKVAKLLCTLRLFESLPARGDWDRALPAGAADIDALMKAVGDGLWHQSQEATDCRWFSLMGRVVTGRMHVPEEIARDWVTYPNTGDQRVVRPSIRSAEISISALIDNPDLTWPKKFWDEAWAHTPCLALIKEKEVAAHKDLLTRSRVREVIEGLRGHWENTHTTTATDARHDGVFGMALYALEILDELMGIGISNSILGRLGLRTLLETRINLRYLIAKADPELWKKWRSYGAGQAKLSVLKFDGEVERPAYIDAASIEQIANEDIWEEFLAVNLAGWSGIDLRKMSQETQLTDSYSKYYNWTSGYSHAMWGPIRESCFKTCGNPLHRLHRYPDMNSLPDVVEDAALLVDQILDDLHSVYPTFTERLCPHEKEVPPPGGT